MGGVQAMQRRLFLVSAACAVMFGSAGAVSRAASEGLEVDGRVALDAYRALVDEYLAGVLTALKGAARSAEAASGKWEAVRPMIVELASGIVAEAAVWYALPDGSYGTAEEGPTPNNLKDRDYFPDLLAGKDVLGPLVISKSTGHRSIIVATPVMVDGKMQAALGVSVRARLLSDYVVTRTNMPADLIFYALDGTGKTVLHRDPEKMFQYPSDMGDPSLDAAVKVILSGESGAVTYSLLGKERTGLFTTSPLTGWRFVLVQEKD
jgi:hypothetical protein